jgi:hypothetical protein
VAAGTNDKLNGGFNGSSEDPFFKLMIGEIELSDDKWFKDREETMQLLTPNRSEIEQCWSLLPHPERSVIRVFARDRETGELDGDFARNAGEMYHFASVTRPSRSTCALTRHARALLACATRLRTLHTGRTCSLMWTRSGGVDPHAAMKKPSRLGDGSDGLRSRPPLSHLIIDSGRGRQAWIRLGT